MTTATEIEATERRLRNALTEEGWPEGDIDAFIEHTKTLALQRPGRLRASIEILRLTEKHRVDQRD